jgi:uncharacterized protein
VRVEWLCAIAGLFQKGDLVKACGKDIVMKSTNLKTTALFLVTLSLLLICGIVHADTLKAVIVTGQNNHDWKTSSPIIKQILENSGRFTAKLAVSPEGTEGMENFKPDFAAFDVVVLDYNGVSWCEQTKQAFVDYVKNGGGVVVIHAADNSFPDWPEYNEIIGLGGWGGRNEKDGPYVVWRDGQIERDERPGPGGGHGRQHPWVCINRNTEHPITKGLPETWMHAKDELYHGLRGPAKNLTVLTTAFSDKKTGGSGEHEPILFTIEYGKGRVFHTVLGHAGGDPAPSGFQCVGFIVTLQRGAEWAATGEVTQDVPADFPTADEVRVWEDYSPK